MRIINPSLLFVMIWVGWVVSWIAASFWSSRIETRAPTRDVWLYRVLIVIGAILLWQRIPILLHEPRLWHVGYAGAYALAGLTLAGILFTWWARLHLGPLWSGAITRKEGHRIVDTGPYALVRHPIYTGLLVAIFATAAAQAALTGMVGAVLIAVGVWMKARTEERFLATELGADCYEAYRRRVPMLVPFLPRG
jgi:protein-S-isoprenylcysteine O-methyltransferase Ste14